MRLAKNILILCLVIAATAACRKPGDRPIVGDGWNCMEQMYVGTLQKSNGEAVVDADVVWSWDESTDRYALYIDCNNTNITPENDIYCYILQINGSTNNEAISITLQDEEVVAIFPKTTGDEERVAGSLNATITLNDMHLFIDFGDESWSFEGKPVPMMLE